MDVAIIGAGLAGLACAARLDAAGHNAVLFDKGRAAGGRMSSRRTDTAQGTAGFDHGAQYFTVRDPAFAARVAEWQVAGLAAPWPAAGEDCWVGTPSMNAPLRHMAAGMDVRWNTRVDAIAGQAGSWRLAGDGVPEAAFDTVLLAVPAENAAPLLAGVAPALAAIAAATPAEPCWTLMAAFAGRVASDADILREDGPIGWAARNSAKPGRTGPEAWVVQAGPAWSRRMLEEKADTVTAELLDALAARIGTALPPLLGASSHRWRYARSGRAGRDCLWDGAARIGVCGDWLLGPRVECAWLSGQALGELART